MLDLQPIKARLAAATPGPWTEEAGLWKAFWGLRRRAYWHNDPLGRDEDADLIVNAPTDLAALVAEVERLRKSLAETQLLADSYGEWSHKMEAEADRLRAAIEAHRKTTALRLGGGSPWATDIELWEVLDA